MRRQAKFEVCDSCAEFDGFTKDSSCNDPKKEIEDRRVNGNDSILSSHGVA